MKGEKNLQSLLKRDIILSIMTRQKRKYAIVDLEATSAGAMLRSSGWDCHHRRWEDYAIL